MERLEKLTARVANEKRLDRAVEAVDKVASCIFPNSRIREGLSHKWLGHPVHPLLVTVPIGAWTCASILDFACCKRTTDLARRLVGIGVIASVPTAVAGLSDWKTNTRNDEQRRVGVTHAIFNYTALTLYSASWIARRRKHRAAGVLLSLAGACAMSAGGYLGGHLTYAMGVGIRDGEHENP